MNAAQLTELLVHSIMRNRKVLVKGKPGIGKTDIVKAAAEQSKSKLVFFHASISDAVDVKGLPFCVDGEAEFLPYGDFRKILNAKTMTTVFLDDLGQAPVSVQAALMQVLHGQRINGYTIPDCVRFVGATNDTSHMAGVSGIIEPVKSRWDTIVTLDVSVDDWCSWGQRNGMPIMLMAYMKSCPQALDDFRPTRELTNSPCPRGWAAVGRWINEGIDEVEVIAGAVGLGRATEWCKFNEMANKLPPLTDVRSDPKGTPLPDNASMQFALTCGLAYTSTEKNISQDLVFMDRMPKQFSHLYVMDAWRKNPKITGSNDLKKWLCRPDNAAITLG